MVPLSVLDLSPVVEGGDAGQSLRNSRDLARHADALGYRRYWMAEHHNMPGIASAATAVALAFVGEGTKHIRLGSGGVMLPNHAPLIIAEQFGTLEAVFPGRVDLGLGRAPGTDQATAYALRRNLPSSVDRFPQDVLELQGYFAPTQPGQLVAAQPGAGSNIPLWILGSSLYGAQLAAMLGLPFAFASHFSPANLEEALRLYRAGFRPSAQLDRPHVMLALSVIAADTDEEAAYLFTSQLQGSANLRLGRPLTLQPPVRNLEALYPSEILAQARHALSCAVVGSVETVKKGLAAFVQRHQADELIVTGQIYDHAARLRSFELAAQARDALMRETAAA